jgi:hypothetical protein
VPFHQSRPSRPRPLESTGPRNALAGSALRVLERHGGTAISAAEMQQGIPLEGGPPLAGERAFLDALLERDDLFRVLAPRPRRWAGAAPGPWILARRPSAVGVGHPVLERIRDSLRVLAEQVDTGSLRETARWERYLLEETRLRRRLERRLRREARRRAEAR